MKDLGNSDAPGRTSRCGYVALAGEPNVGKSTLVNRMVGESISIVTAKPQTTRNKICAILSTPTSQIIFLDTPGLHDPEGSLGAYMNSAAQSAFDECDICLWIIDAGKPNCQSQLDRLRDNLWQRYGNADCQVIIALNKIDTLRDKHALLPLMAAAAEIPKAAAVVPISALLGDGVDRLQLALETRLPEGPKLFPDDMLSEQQDRFFAAEMIRKTITEQTHQEVPYGTAVVIDRFVEESKQCVIYATIYVERTSQRGIMVGKGGSMIKKIGTLSREAIRSFLQCPVVLHLRVDVSRDWTKNRRELKKMGYE
ncbi:MAG: GTPase Era [Myxococcota bacterium]|nr:GTPase Era [Myxococcota bacterium]